MELNVINNIAKNKNSTKSVDSFIEELKNKINNKNTSKTSTIDVKTKQNSNLSYTNNILKNNKMTIENKEKFLLKEIRSINEIYDNNKESGDLYYVTSKGANSDFYVRKLGKSCASEIILKEEELPKDVKVGGIYRMQENGELKFNKAETKKHENNMKSAAKEILKEQEKDGGYKKEFTTEDLKTGSGYPAEYFEYPLGITEELGKEAGLPATAINDLLEDDVNEAFDKVAKEMSEDKTIYVYLPEKYNTIYKISNGKKEKTDLGEDMDLWDEEGSVFKENKNGELVKDEKSTKEFHNEVLKELKETVKVKYDNICDDYKKEGHIYEVDKKLDENYIPTITISDISENRLIDIEDLDFVENEYLGEGYYTVKDGKYYMIDVEEKIEKNNTVDKDKEDESNFASIMSKKYNVSRDDVEKIINNYMLEKSESEGVVVYTGYDKEKDEYYMDYYQEGSFDERKVVNKTTAYNMGVGNFCTMGRDELDYYSGYFLASDIESELEEIIKAQAQ